MIVRKLEEVKNALLHDAILIAIQQGYRFNRVYIDKEGGCNIKFYGKMNIDDIKLFLVNLSPNKYINKDLDEIDRNLKNLERYYDELKLYLDK